jgi:hypothetical protein
MTSRGSDHGADHPPPSDRLYSDECSCDLILNRLLALTVAYKRSSRAILLMS